jgi:coenzyme PQQ synthesis protein D (PqqD)
MQDNDVFRVNGPHVISENIDGEVVLVNLGKGLYYSTDQVGADLWGLLEAGHNVRTIGNAISARYDGEPEKITAAVVAFLAELLQEELIVTEPSVPEREVREMPAAGAPADKVRFQPPTLNKYTDMRDMLLLDPIHDVEESGWPVPKSAP